MVVTNVGETPSLTGEFVGKWGKSGGSKRHCSLSDPSQQTAPQHSKRVGPPQKKSKVPPPYNITVVPRQRNMTK